MMNPSSNGNGAETEKQNMLVRPRISENFQRSQTIIANEMFLASASALCGFCGVNLWLAAWSHSRHAKMAKSQNAEGRVTHNTVMQSAD
ncbi:hypothetical protein CPB86DRAFT_785721 [Serendipita vermifera]|nr:hypothetical protein CPB86DRAFT_785721 [Serendipita vermifera]